MFIAYCPELDIPACGVTIVEAKKNLIEVINIQISEMKKLGTFKENLEKAGFDLANKLEVISLDKELMEFNNILVTAQLKPLHHKKLFKIFEKFGCIYSHTRGDHKIYHFKGAKRAVVIPKYKEVPVFIIKNNMRTIGMVDSDFKKLLNEV